MQIAELAPEGEMLLRGDVLIPEEDHEIFGERAMNLVHLAVRARIVGNQFADIDAGNLRADDRGEFFHADGLIGLASVCGVPIARALLAGERTHGRSSDRFLFGRIVARMERSAIRILLVPALTRELYSPGS